MIEMIDIKDIPYIEHFTRATKEHWLSEMGCIPKLLFWFIAQAKAESTFDPKAISRAGACGIMQIMPRTWREIRLYLRHLGPDILDPKDNIDAGIWYSRFCYDRLKTISGGNDRLLMAFAAYNCGPTRIVKLIKEYSPVTYADLETHIPYIETVDYVRKIIKFQEEYNKEAQNEKV